MEKIIGWWSGGITSAVACKIAIDMYGVNDLSPRSQTELELNWDDDTV